MPPPPPKQQQKNRSPDRNPDRNPDRTPERALPKDQQDTVAEMARGLEELRLTFEQYFMGNERVPPQEKRATYVGQLRRLKESGAIRNTVAKFQLNNLWSKYQTYDQMWNRILTQIEEGTYKRDRFKVGLRKKQAAAGPVPAEQVEELELEDLDFSVEEADDAPPVAPARPAVPAPMPMAARPAGPAPLAAPPRPGGPVPAAQPAAIPATFLQRGTAPGAPGAPQAGAPAFAPRPAAPPGVAGAAPVRAQPTMGPVTSQPPRPAAPPNAAMPRPAAAAAPARPATAPPAAARPQGDISDDYLRRIERTLSDTRKKIGDATETNFDTLKAQLAKQVPLIKQQHGAKSVEFQVVVKDGKALLKAIPKK